ncbi:MAG: serine hydrolase domain-containing protein, partial [SAR202 cluster bacterium]|nr:serine hydrolase domain-containing protein [SAR202 cluster bacterium]
PELKGIEVISEFDESDSSYSTRPAAREITLRHLLTQTSGFGYPFSSNVLSKLSGQLPEYHPLLHDPGIRWTYGMGTRVVGRVIEQVTGESLVVFFKSRIFGPLGMSDTGFDLKPEDRTRLASSFNRVNGELVGEQNPASHELRVGGDAGLLGTASDYIRFLQMLLGMGQFDGARILTEQSVSEMTQNQIGNLVVEAQPGAIPERSSAFPLDAGEDKFGLGFQLKEREESGARSPGSYSWAGIRNTHFWGDPKLGIAAVMLTQVLPFYDDRCIQLLTDFENVVYRNLE